MNPSNYNSHNGENRDVSLQLQNDSNQNIYSEPSKLNFESKINNERISLSSRQNPFASTNSSINLSFSNQGDQNSITNLEKQRSNILYPNSVNSENQLIYNQAASNEEQDDFNEGYNKINENYDYRNSYSKSTGRNSSISNRSKSQISNHPSEDFQYSETESNSLTAQKLMTYIKQNGIEDLPIPLYEVILILNNFRLECQQNHLYSKCEAIDKVLKGIRILEEKRHISSLKEAQISEKMNLEMQHKVEIDQLQKLWDTRFSDFGTYVEELRNSMAERHIREFEEFKLKFNFELNRVPKFSKKVINLRSIERTLVNQNLFKEAEKIKKKANQVQSNELVEKSKRIAERFEKQKELLIKRHEKEADALQLKITKIQHDLQIGRGKDIENAKRRYINTINNIEKNQNILLKKTMRYIKTHEHNTKLSGLASTKIQENGSTRSSLNTFENTGSIYNDNYSKNFEDYGVNISKSQGRHTAIGGSRSSSVNPKIKDYNNRSQTPLEFGNSKSYAYDENFDQSSRNSKLTKSSLGHSKVDSLPPMKISQKNVSPSKSKQKDKLREVNSLYNSNRKKKIETKNFPYV